MDEVTAVALETVGESGDVSSLVELARQISGKNFLWQERTELAGALVKAAGKLGASESPEVRAALNELGPA